MQRATASSNNAFKRVFDKHISFRMTFIENTIASIEKKQSLLASAVVFIAAFAIRETLERMLLASPFDLQLASFHFTYFAFSILFISGLLSQLTKTAFSKTLKVVLFFFPLVLVGPLLDYFMLHNSFANYTFLETGPTSIPVFLIGWSLFFVLETGHPISMKIGVALMILAAGVYLWTKIRSRLRATASLALFYCLFGIFLAGHVIQSCPGCAPSTSILPYPLLTLGSARLTAPGGWVISYFSIYLLLTTITAALLWFRTNPAQFISLLRNLRAARLLGFLLFAIMGFALAKGTHPFDLVIALSSVMFIWSFGVATNDLADVKIDRISNKGRPLIRGIITAEGYGYVGIASALLALAFSYAIGGLAPMIALAVLGLGLIYSFKPIRFRRFLFSTVMSASFAGAAFLLGYLSASPSGFDERAISFFAAIAVSTALGYNMKDMKDMRGDVAGKVSTLLTVFGKERGRIAIAALLFLSYPLFALLSGLVSLLPAAILVGVLSAFFIFRKPYRELPILLIYLSALLFIIYSLMTI